MECAVEDCDSEATFELHIPWAENEYVCAGHARVRGREEGVVADPLDTAGDALPDGADQP
ncbi:hypothetical protein [Halovenus marina]|uniref:hypothetical protein n=1 Tax=Halovenus marina TaxID=3396621 RepID=UPI003F5740CE